MDGVLKRCGWRLPEDCGEIVYWLLIHFLDPRFSTWAFGTSCGVKRYFRVDMIEGMYLWNIYLKNTRKTRKKEKNYTGSKDHCVLYTLQYCIQYTVYSINSVTHNEVKKKKHTERLFAESLKDYKVLMQMRKKKGNPHRTADSKQVIFLLLRPKAVSVSGSTSGS